MSVQRVSTDSISSLPDEVLGKVLSLLPTKQAASTSVLSKRWRNLLSLVDSLDLSDDATATAHSRRFSSGQLDPHCPGAKKLLGTSLRERVYPRYRNKVLRERHARQDEEEKDDDDDSVSGEEDAIIEDEHEYDDDDNDDILPDVTNLVAGIINVKTLHLSPKSLEVFHLYCKSMPVFHKLLTLSFESDKERGWQVVPLLLNNSPNLETLVIKGLVHRVTDRCGDACVCVAKEEEVCCLSTCQVKVLKVSGYRGTRRELNQMKHFLGNLKCLETVKVGVEVENHREDKNVNKNYQRITNALTKLPIASSNPFLLIYPLYIVIPSNRSCYNHRPFVKSLYTCQTLVTLRLLYTFIVDVPLTICFPSLKTLRLRRVEFSNDEIVPRILSGCPVLEDLTVVREHNGSVKNITIMVPSLLRLTVLDFKFGSQVPGNDVGFVIKASLNQVSWVCSLVNMPNLVKANIKLPPPGDSKKLLECLTSAKHLSLCAIPSTFSYPIGVFHHLVSLKLCTCCSVWFCLILRSDIVVT
ncbi:hypothetical protein HID58_062538 [Brassica napus]|uniref:F-box domain-containing protein n=1 Tax=Brassica napus TaxID=3708 RepID=A0ABQ8A1P5_BRANA|nr:hypothetical protein HID58_062538 [Brassica napus]